MILEMIEEGFEKGGDSSRVYMRSVADIRSYTPYQKLNRGMYYEYSPY